MKKKAADEVNREENREDVEATSPECDGGSVCEVHDIPVPPDGGWGWVIVLCSFMCNLIVDGIAYTFGVFLPEFVRYFNEGKGTVAWVGSLLAGVYLSCGPIVSALTNKFGCRTTCIIGSGIGCVAFALSSLSGSVTALMITYGIVGGIGFGLIYLPAIVSVGYYFEKKRALATGIAVCGSGFGTFVFAPLANQLLENFDWKGANLILAGVILNCAVFGSLMRPLESPKKRCKPLLQRMAEDKALQMERGSLMGSSYFMVQLPDGTYEKRLKVPVNVDPGVHSSFNLDQLAQQAPGASATGHPHPVPPSLPTINESKATDAAAETLSGASHASDSPAHKDHKENDEAEAKESDKLIENGKTAVAAMRGSRGSLGKSETALKRRSGVSSGSKDDVSSLSASKSTLSKTEKKDLARPLARQDVLYTGSVTKLPEYQSQKSLASFRQSMVSLPKASAAQRGGEDVQKEEKCCFCLPASVGNLMDFSLMKDAVFLFLGVSNIFGMLGFYVPFVYIIDSAQLKGVDNDSASFLLSIIGITNTVGRVISGYISDFPAVDSLLVTNICITVSGLAVFCVPFCSGYISYCFAAGIFGLFSSAFIALTSIVLVDLLGIQQLTNAFGLLCLLRGVAAIIGPPLAGSVYDATLSYDVPFWLAGVFLFIAAAISFMVPFVRRYVSRKNAAKARAIESGELKELKRNDSEVPRVVQTQATPATSPVKV